MCNCVCTLASTAAWLLHALQTKCQLDEGVQHDVCVSSCYRMQLLKAVLVNVEMTVSSRQAICQGSAGLNKLYNECVQIV